MINEKLGVLLVDVPEPRLFKYYFINFSETGIGKNITYFGWITLNV